jgi:hypothetical protein
MDDPSTPSAIIAQTLQRTFPSKGNWENWKPLADHILAGLREAGFGVVPTRLQDQRLAGQALIDGRPGGAVLPFAPSPPAAKLITALGDDVVRGAP